MHRFRYLRDPLFLAGCAAYALNRWLLKPHLPSGFLHSHFNDLLLIPALPPILWLHRQLGLRSRDHTPTSSEIALHLIFWSALFEWIGPKFVSIPPPIRWTWSLIWSARCWPGVVAARALARRFRPIMSFDTLAPYYRGMESILAGQKFHRCRTAFLITSPSPETFS